MDKTLKYIDYKNPPILFDKRVPKNEFWFVDDNGDTILKITNLKVDKESHEEPNE